jgi:2-dehydro-3-deoxyphosphogluconate aldolase / (4S)-4-hydroxy-2-oxoglutarate aldolase
VTPADVVAAVARHRVVAIVRRAEAEVEEVVAVADALVAGGLPVVEVTTNTPGAFEAVARLRDREDAVVGVGTVLDVEDVEAAAKSGARFVVSPHVDEAVIARARDLGLASLPGACSPTEIHRAVVAGADLVKLFPAGPIGGVDYLAAVRGPFADVGLVPTGGIGVEDAADYLRAGATGVGLSSALVEGDSDQVRARARRLVGLLQHETSGV